MTAASTAPRTRSLTGWLASRPMTDGGSPDHAIRYSTSTTGVSASAMLTICSTRSNQLTEDSGPTSSACWLLSECRDSRAPMRSSSAFSPLAPSETAKTAKISHRR